MHELGASSAFALKFVCDYYSKKGGIWKFWYGDEILILLC